MTITIIDTKPKVKLIRGMSGKYGWEISAYGDSLEDVIKELKKADDKLKAEIPQ